MGGYRHHSGACGGLAWGEDSGLTWDEKYQLWVASTASSAIRSSCLAHELGRGSQWPVWSADESCPQAGVAVDTARATAPNFCELEI